MKIPNTHGVATLPTVIVMGIIALAIAVGITAVSLTESFISQGSGQSSRALFYAESGARDALIKIARKKNYSTGGYSISFGGDISSGCVSGNDGCAQVQVSTGAGATGDPKIITSIGIMKSSMRTVIVSTILDNGTADPALQFGKISTTTWSESTN